MVKYSDTMPVVRPALGAPSLREHGTELLSTLTCAGTTTKLFGMYVAPITLGKRIAVLANCYEMYRIRRLRFIVALACPTTVSGTFCHAYDHDISDPDPLSSLDGIKTMSTWAESKLFATMDGQLHYLDVTSFRNPLYYNSYDTPGDLRWSIAGQYYLYVLAGSSSITATISVEYDVDFYKPELTDMVAAKFAYKNLGNIEMPTTDYAWDVVDTILNAISLAIPQVKFVTVGAHYMLRFTHGIYTLQQNYLPNTGLTTSCGFTAPAVHEALGTPPTIVTELQNLSLKDGSPAMVVNTITVPLGSIATLVGKFLATLYIESSTPQASFVMSRNDLT
jgi:hypothetical protein